MGHERRVLQKTATCQLPLCPVSDRVGVAMQYVAKGPGCVKRRRRSIAIEQVIRSTQLRAFTPQAHSTLRSNLRTSFSSRFEFLSFHTAWANRRHHSRYSITLSGVTSNVDGAHRPNVLAVFSGRLVESRCRFGRIGLSFLCNERGSWR